jgi:hypothetical protein
MFHEIVNWFKKELSKGHFKEYGNIYHENNMFLWDRLQVPFAFSDKNYQNDLKDGVFLFNNVTVRNEIFTEA